MAQRVIIPRLGQTMTEGTVAKWLAAQDQRVNAGDPVYELEYDKATAVVEAKKSGIFKRLAEEGAKAAVGETVGVILEEGEKLEDILSQKTFTVANSAKAASGSLYTQPEPEKKEAPKAAYTPPASFKCTGDCPRNKPANSTDTIVIGGGPGGYVAALRLALLGAKVTLVEKDTLGGTCLNRGCIPTKALLQSAEMYTACLQAAEFGVKAEQVSFDYSVVCTRRKKTVDALVGGVKGLLKARKVEVISGEAAFEGPHTINVKLSDGTEKKLTADNIIIASGSVPAKPPIPGLDGKNVITSDEALVLESIPESMVIIGGGVIGMELAMVFSSFNCTVTVVEALPEILPGIDGEIAKNYRRIAAKRMAIYSGAAVASVTDAGDAKCVLFNKEGNEQKIEAQYVLVATGRRPETAALQLGAAGIKAERGRITVDDKWRTNIAGVYCIGDANGKTMLAHAASAQGIDAADLIMGHTPDAKRHRVIPACIYTDPEIASVGRTEEQLKNEGMDYKASKFSFRANGRALTLGKAEGFVKILSDKVHNEVLGVHIMGPNATELIGECALAMRMECCLEELAETIHAHPTLGEAVMEAAEAGLFGAIHSL
jgi:dihydrolipoamide dehydrogenase